MQTSLRRFSLFAIPFLVAAPALAQNAGSEGCAATARIVAGVVAMVRRSFVARERGCVARGWLRRNVVARSSTTTR